MLAAEFYEMTRLDPDAEGTFVFVDDEKPVVPGQPEIDIDKLRENWGRGPVAQAGLQAALGTASRARKR